MSAVHFESLGSLSAYIAEHGIRVVDPGVPLEQVVAASDDVWANQPSVRKVVGFIARNIASVPLHVYERVTDTDRLRVTDHPMASLMGAPAPFTTPFRFWELVLIDWLLHDRWCVQKVPRLDESFELVRIPVRRFRLKSDSLDRVEAVEVLVGGGRWVPHDPSGFIFDRGYARVGANGTSPMETLKDLLAESAEAVAYRRGVWRNGARVPAVLERPTDAPKWSPDAKRRFLGSWRNYIRGGGEEGGTPILEDGMTLKEANAFSPRDTEDLEGRKLTDAEVASAYHIAPELVGAREGTYSNIEAYRQMLYRDNLGPHITQWEQTINTMLVPDLAGDRPLYVEAHVEAKLRGSFEEQAAILQSAVGAPWMLRAEARGRMNLPQIDGTDELVTPMNVTVGGLANPRDTGPKSTRRHGVKALESDLGTVAAEVAALVTDLAAYQQRLADDVLSGLGAKQGPPPLDDAFDVEAWNVALARTVGGRSRRVAQAGAGEVLDRWNPGRDGWDPDVMDPWLTRAAQTNAVRANQSFYDDLVQALMVGDGWREAAQAVLAAEGFATVWGATIGTESASFGRQDAASASGLETKTWRTTSSDPRSSHVALSGVTIGIADVFANGARWPGDWQAGASEVVNCSCVLDYSRGDE